MTSHHNAKCSCGFHKSVRVGGNIATHDKESYFPFYCEKDGLVSVNVSESSIRCPYCQSSKITQYGILPISKPKKNQHEGLPALQNCKFLAYCEDNLCPNCKKMSLVFSGAYMRTD